MRGSGFFSSTVCLFIPAGVLADLLSDGSIIDRPEESDGGWDPLGCEEGSVVLFALRLFVLLA
eukprot:CAMPEP_0185785990 /NCGR_PEP_ID=MMETSP1174-20130828/132825_1 /TAXON_ID=35687 /ORGANISM="Dictyocha speculum, Strain CCMP1381" /LENGTH=62 /DNA_ID=CAMNT_0028478367 /DNA_START=186 /DNA_END=374 /DNA_ORIENTATION=-